MPQVFQVLRCYKCFVFQIHQRKKSNKWECKVCGEKQSIKRHYGLGTGQECRKHVQKLNGIRGEIDQSNTSMSEVCTDEDIDDECNSIFQESKVTEGKSKWSEYIDYSKINYEEAPVDTMYLDTKEDVLEIPKKQRRKTLVKNGNNQNKELDNNIICSGFVDNVNVGNKNVESRVNALQTLSFCTPKLSVNFANNNFHSQNIILESQLEDEIKGNNLSNLIHNSYSKWAQYIDDGKDCDNTIFGRVNRKESKKSNNSEFHIDNSHQKKQRNHKISENLVNRNNSKWGQFIKDENNYYNTRSNTERNNIVHLNKQDEKMVTQIKKTNPHVTKSRNLFSLCDDNELDLVLEI